MIEAWADNVARIETEKRRLVILEYLLVTPGYEASAAILRQHCTRLGVPSTLDQILGAFAWLEQQELITLRAYQAETIGRITPAGREVALGLQTQPGVMRPDP